MLRAQLILLLMLFVLLMLLLLTLTLLLLLFGVTFCYCCSCRSCWRCCCCRCWCSSRPRWTACARASPRRAAATPRRCVASTHPPPPRCQRQKSPTWPSINHVTLAPHVNVNVTSPPNRKKAPHREHDKLLGALPLDARHHPARLVALGAFLAAPARARALRRLRLPKRKLGLDADAPSALERLEAHEPVARERELAHLRLALRHRERQQARRAALQRRLLDRRVEQHRLTHAENRCPVRASSVR